MTIYFQYYFSSEPSLIFKAVGKGFFVCLRFSSLNSLADLINSKIISHFHTQYILPEGGNKEHGNVVFNMTDLILKEDIYNIFSSLEERERFIISGCIEKFHLFGIDVDEFYSNNDNAELNNPKCKISHYIGVINSYDSKFINVEKSYQFNFIIDNQSLNEASIINNNLEKDIIEIRRVLLSENRFYKLYVSTPVELAFDSWFEVGKEISSFYGYRNDNDLLLSEAPFVFSIKTLQLRGTLESFKRFLMGNPINRYEC